MISQTLLLNPEQQVYHFETLNSFKAVAHAVTARNSFSFADFNLSFHTGQENQVIENREALQHFFNAASLTIPKQCHGIKVMQVTTENAHEIPLDTDALISNVQKQVIGVLSADCVPVLFYDPIKQVVGAAHAGWKGTVANIVGETLQAMHTGYGCNPATVCAYIGPSISKIHFEVGKEVEEEFDAIGLASCIIPVKGMKAHIDLWLANKLLLQRAGVKSENITTAGLCTFDHTDQFYSARKEGFQTGRFGAFIMLR